MAKQTFTTGQVLTAAQMTSLQQTAMGGGSATAKTASYVLVAADAGTTVAMNAAGSTTITVNTGLFSAGDTVFIQNWGAGTCTVTAGTATVNTHGSLALGQYEGGTLYFTSSSAAIFFDISQTSGMTNPMTTTGDTIYSSSGSTPARLGIGSTGQVLTVSGGVPTWATPASGGGMTLLDTLSLSGSSVTSTTFSSSYKQLFIYYKKVYCSTASDLSLRLNADTGTNYNYRNMVASDGAVNSYEGENATSFRVGPADTSSTEKITAHGFITFMNPSQTDTIFGVSSTYRVNAGDIQNWNSTLLYDNSAAITSVTLFVTTSFSGGTAYIYGVN